MTRSAAKMSKAPNTGGARIAPATANAVCAAVLIAAFGSLVLLQGGFYPLQTCAVGLATAISAAVIAIAVLPRDTLKGDLIAPLLLAGIGCAALAGSMASGITLTMASESSKWFCVAAVALLVAVAPAQSKRAALGAACWFGIACALVGILVMAGVLPIYGERTSPRLEFPFQYANTSGLFYGAVALLCLFSDRRMLKLLSCAPMLALLLTQSVGAISVFALAVLAMCFPTLRKTGRWWPVAVSAGAVAVAVILAVALIPERAYQASQTVVERFIQIQDGLALLSASPLLGIGADAWSWQYPYAQSAQYQASAIHCGYLQIALDSGIVGLSLFLAFAIHGIRTLVRQRDALSLAVACMILFHASLDFDFRFSAMLVLLAIVLSSESGHEASVVTGASGGMENDSTVRKDASQRILSWNMKIASIPRRDAPQRVSSNRDKGQPDGRTEKGKRLPLARITHGEPSKRGLTGLVCRTALSGVCALACAGGIASSSLLGQVRSAGLAGDVETVGVVMRYGAIAQQDISVRTNHYAALLQSGNNEGIGAYEHEVGIASAEQALLCSSGLFRAGEGKRAGDVLVRELQREPYNVELFEQAEVLFNAYGADSAVEDDYLAAVKQAKELATQGNAKLLANQVTDIPCSMR